MAKWEYTLRCGKDLRDAIHAGDTFGVLDALHDCYDELYDEGFIDDYDYESWTEELDDVDPDDEDEVDYQLNEFYDLCDNIRVWIPMTGYESAEFDLG